LSGGVSKPGNPDHTVLCVIPGFRRSVYEIFALLGCYAALIDSYRRFGTTYRYHLQGSSSLSVGEIFCIRPDRPGGSLSLLYNGYRVSFPWVGRSGIDANHPPPSSDEVKERVELYLYSLSGPSRPVLG